MRDSYLIEKKIYTLKLNCYFCKSQKHLIQDCTELHFIADKEKVILKNNFPRIELDRNKVKRNREIKQKGYFNAVKNQALAYYGREQYIREN